MPRNEYKFHPALPYPIKWSTGDNTFDDSEKNPKTIGLAIPVESIPAFCDYLMSLGDNREKVKAGKVWDFSKKEEVEVDVVWINAKGKDGTTRNGAFGNINPQKTQSQIQAQEATKFSASDEIPF